MNESIITESFENIVAKGEIARFEQFFLLSLCFQKSSAVYVQKASVGGKGLERE